MQVADVAFSQRMVGRGGGNRMERGLTTIGLVPVTRHSDLVGGMKEGRNRREQEELGLQSIACAC